MLRDNNKNKEYFDSFILETSARSHKFINTLHMLPKADFDKIKQCELYISNFERDILYAMYSRGDSKNDLVTQFKVYLSHIIVNGCSGYYEYLTLLSLVILFDIKESGISNILEDVRFDDSLVQIFKNYIKNNKIVISDFRLKYDNYKKFLGYLTDKVDFPDFCDFIENTWYSTCSDLYWYNNLKSKQNTYTGYWCWIGAAVLKMKKIKTCELKFIPKDLL